MAVDLQAAHTAFVLVSMQKGLLARGGPIDEVGPTAQSMVQASKQVIAACRAKGMPIMYVKLMRRADGRDKSPHLASPDARVTEGTQEIEIVDDLAPQPNDYIVEKRRQGSFYGTHLEMFLRRNGVDTILLGGTATSAGVESTFREAADRDFRVVVVRDCCSGGEDVDSKHSFERVFPARGVVVGLAEAVESISQAK